MRKPGAHPNITPYVIFDHLETLKASDPPQDFEPRCSSVLPFSSKSRGEARLAKFLPRVLDEVQVRDLCSPVFQL